jgi:predicted DNA-binding transcriptional regulator AlpA
MTSKYEYPVLDRFISEGEAAKILNVSKPTLKRMRDPPRLQVASRRVAYRLSDILRKIATATPKRAVGGPSP